MGLTRFGLDRFMKVVITVEDTSAHKPDAAPIHKALKLLGAWPDEALYVGDSVHDIAAARAAGVKAAAALWGPFPREDLVRAQPDFLLRSMRDLLDLCPPPSTDKAGLDSQQSTHISDAGQRSNAPAGSESTEKRGQES